MALVARVRGKHCGLAVSSRHFDERPKFATHTRATSRRPNLSFGSALAERARLVIRLPGVRDMTPAVRTIVSLGMYLLISAPAIAASGSVTGKLVIEFQVLPGCAFADDTGGSPSNDGRVDGVLDFGRAAGDLAGAVDNQVTSTATGSALAIVCSSSFTGPGAPSVTFDAGLHSAGSTQRQMAGPGGARIPYSLYQDQARSIPYVPGTGVQLVIGNSGIATPINIFGRVPSVAGLSDGIYSDTVTLTLSY